MAYSSVVGVLKTRLDTITGIGATHARQRYFEHWSDILDKFQVTIGGIAQYRGWWLTLNNITVVHQTFNNKVLMFDIGFIGIMSYSDDDNSETTFLDLLETVIDTLHDTPNSAFSAIPGVVGSTFGVESTALIDLRNFGTALCHYAEGRFTLALETVYG